MLAKFRARAAALVLISLCASALSGCSLLHRHQKSDEEAYVERPVDQLYSVGAQRLDERHWQEGINYFKEVERQHPYSEWSRRAILMQAFAHYEADQYDDAIADANRFIQLYPGNTSTPYAYYLKAECYFEQILDVGRDQAATEQALASMREVARRYPKSEYATDARLKIDMINDQLAGKEMNIGRFYLRSGDMLAAIGRFKSVVDRYQTTSDAPEALYRLVEAYLTLGLVDEAKRNAAVLGYNFPGDIWYADAYKLMTARGYEPSVRPTGEGRRRHMLHFPSLHAARAATPAPPTSDAAAPAPDGQSPAVSTAPDTQAPAPDATAAPAKSHHWLHWPFGAKTSGSGAAASSPAPSN